MAQCQFPNCRTWVRGDGKYCPGHQKMGGAAPVTKEKAVAVKAVKKKPLPKRTKKMAKGIRTLGKLVKEFLAKPGNEVCNIKSPVCTHQATCVNHKKGRGKYLLDVKFFQPACVPCNNYIESNDSFGREGGHKVSRLNK